MEASRRYCWPVHSVADLRLAPFHLLAGEQGVYVDRDHLWHMQTLARLAAAAAGTPLMATKCVFGVLALESEPVAPRL